jgi:hypothetical protein
MNDQFEKAVQCLIQNSKGLKELLKECVAKEIIGINDEGVAFSYQTGDFYTNEVVEDHEKRRKK